MMKRKMMVSRWEEVRGDGGWGKEIRGTVYEEMEEDYGASWSSEGM